MKGGKIVSLSLRELAELTMGCARNGCTEHFRGPMPKGWRWMLLYYEAVPATPGISMEALAGAQRDCCLCPRHAAELDASLWPIPKWPMKTEGSA